MMVYRLYGVNCMILALELQHPTNQDTRYQNRKVSKNENSNFTKPRLSYPRLSVSRWYSTARQQHSMGDYVRYRCIGLDPRIMGVYKMIHIQKHWHNGSITLSAIRKGEYCKQTYYGYTQKEALKEFRQTYPTRQYTPPTKARYILCIGLFAVYTTNTPCSNTLPICPIIAQRGAIVPESCTSPILAHDSAQVENRILRY